MAAGPKLATSRGKASGAAGLLLAKARITFQQVGFRPEATGKLLRGRTPIWSDARAVEEAKQVFQRIPEAEWYRMTGNGFPAQLYSSFKLMWFRDHEPEMFKQIAIVLGTKDYINYKLTGVCATDQSYASGSGVYDLKARAYSSRLI